MAARLLDIFAGLCLLVFIDGGLCWQRLLPPWLGLSREWGTVATRPPGDLLVHGWWLLASHPLLLRAGATVVSEPTLPCFLSGAPSSVGLTCPQKGRADSTQPALPFMEIERVALLCTPSL